MRFYNNLKILVCSAGLALLLSQLSYGQTYSFINYGAEKQIPSVFVYTIVQSNDGFLWVGTASGLSRFDGYQFFPVQYPDSVIGRYPTKSLKDKNGTLWFGCSDGTVFCERNNKLISVPITNSKSISELLEGPDGLIYIISQGKYVFSVNPLKPEEVHQYSLAFEPALYCAAFTNAGKMLIGTQEGLFLCRVAKDSISVIREIDGFDFYGVTSILKTGDGSKFILGTDDNGLFQMKLSDKGVAVKAFTDHLELRSLKVQSVTEDANGSYWASTNGSGVIQFEVSDDFESIKSERFYDLNSGLNENDVKLVFQDIQGNYWFALYGEGLSMLTSYSLSYYTPGRNSQENDILFVKNFNTDYILGTPAGFHIFNPVTGKSVSFTDLTKQIGRAEIKSYSLDDENNLWIGTSGNGLFVRNKNGQVKRFYKSGDTGSDDIKDIEMDKNYIWLATTNGVIVLDKGGNTIKKFDINNGLPHNSINKIFLATGGVAYIGTETDKLYKIDASFNITTGVVPMSGNTRKYSLLPRQVMVQYGWLQKGTGYLNF